jgi:hypothetical protein
MDSQGSKYVNSKQIKFQRRGNSEVPDGRGTIKARFDNFDQSSEAKRN